MQKALPKSFHALNITQFLVVFNDNVFKFLIVYLLIDLYGEDSASAILAFSGMIFVIPFLLFSFFAGSLCDAGGKRNMIIITKTLEVGIALLGWLFLAYQYPPGLWLTLFLYALQSAFFSPAKLGIIAELVEEKMVTKANGQMAAAMYMAVIIGSLSASLLLDITARNYLFVGSICVLTSTIGLITATSIEIKRTKTFSAISYQTFLDTIKWFKQTQRVVPAVIGEAFFFMLGAFVQLNLIPFAMRSLRLDDLIGGYLFFVLAIGISLGAYVCGVIPSKNPKIYFTPLAAVVIAIMFFLLDLLSENIEPVCFVLIFLGIAGGFFEVPLASFLQRKSPDHLRGKVMSINNFVSFIGILLASVLLYVLQDLLEISPDTCFTLLGISSLGIGAYLYLKIGAFDPLAK